MAYEKRVLISFAHAYLSFYFLNLFLVVQAQSVCLRQRKKMVLRALKSKTVIRLLQFSSVSELRTWLIGIIERIALIGQNILFKHFFKRSYQTKYSKHVKWGGGVASILRNILRTTFFTCFKHFFDYGLKKYVVTTDRRIDVALWNCRTSCFQFAAICNVAFY